MGCFEIKFLFRDNKVLFCLKPLWFTSVVSGDWLKHGSSRGQAVAKPWSSRVDKSRPTTLAKGIVHFTSSPNP